MAEDAANCNQRQSAEDNETLVNSITMTQEAIELCLSNKFVQAKTKLEPWVKESMYHALAYSTITCIQAVMAFEPQAIQQALNSINLSLEISERYRRKQSWTESLTSWIWYPPYDDLTEVERHAELCHTESLFISALLTFFQDENLISFLRGAFKIRSCYQSYKACYEMAISQPSSPQQSAQKKDFDVGVNLGIGGFNLILSLLPPRILKLLEWVGFSGDRSLGLNLLDVGCRNQTLRAPICAMLLLAYHTWITAYLGIGNGDVEYAEEILQPHLEKFPKGVIFLFFAGRIEQVKGRLDEAIEKHEYSIAVQSEFKELHHISYWELLWCYAYKGDWARAYHYANALLEESLWSRTVYMHLKASFRVMARLLNQPIAKEDDRGDEDTEEYMFRHLPDFKQCIAGQYIPFEEFAILKAKKYFEQNRRLFLPGLEVMYFWNGFKVLRHRPDLVYPLLELVEKSLTELEESKDENNNYVDDWCLGKILQGMCYRCINKRDKAMECLQQAVLRSVELVQDLYLAQFACAEVGFLHLEDGDLDQAKEILECARQHENHLLQGLLHFRIHAALQDINHRNTQVNEESKRAQNDTTKESKEVNSSHSLENSTSRVRQDSDSSFDSLPEYNKQELEPSARESSAN